MRRKKEEEFLQDGSWLIAQWPAMARAEAESQECNPGLQVSGRDHHYRLLVCKITKPDLRHGHCFLLPI